VDGSYNLMAASLRELLEQDEISPLDEDELDDAVWSALCERISTPRDTEQFQHPVAVYYASRLLQWDVCNGGFAQAAFNIPEWFELAAEGYNSLGKTESANIIKEVRELLAGNEEGVKRLRDGEDEWEVYFGDDVFSIFDERIFASDEWEIDQERIAYVRANRDAFKM
jgi:hypothetical protein